jgi:hypothetical protein
MNEHAAGRLGFAIGGLAIAVAMAIVLGFAYAGGPEESPAERRRHALFAALVLAAWMTLTGLLAARGVLSDLVRRPPPMLLVIVAALGLAVALGLSRAGGRLARGLPLAALVGFHAFRLPLELVMHAAAQRGVMPPQMSFGGYNFDIVSGATAIVVAGLAARGAPRALVWAWNLMALALLGAIVVIAIASMPLVHAFGSEPRLVNGWFAQFPTVWLPTVLAASALFGHVVLTRRLWSSPR